MKKLIIALAVALSMPTVATSCGVGSTATSSSSSESGDNILGKVLGGLAGKSSSNSSSSSSSSNSSSSSSGSILGNVLGGLTGGNSTLSSLADLVIGSVKLSQSDLIGTWYYKEPACAFTSDNLLAKAGGAVAAGKVNEQLSSAYQKAGVSSNNTYLTFSEDGTFKGKIRGITVGGSYTFDSSESSLKLKMVLLSTTAYVTRTTNGLSFTFESKKLLSLLQAVSKLSGNSTLSTIGDLSTNYEGVRVGFDMKK